MSIENNLASIATSLATIAAYLTKNEPQASQAVPAPVPPVPAQAPQAAPAIPAPPVMPMPAAPAAPAAPLPFHDQQSLMSYVMTKYKELGPAKGGMIQNVLAELGISHVSGLPPEQYAAFYLKVEAL